MRCLLFLLCVAAGPAWADCPMDLGRGTGWVIFSAHYMISFRPDPMRVEIGEPVALILNVCTKDSEAAELVRVTVQPAEGQSTGKRASSQQLTIVRGESGRYRAEGLVLGAAGHWEIDFDVRSPQGSEQLTHEIVVK
jgi:hypothetical protein